MEAREKIGLGGLEVDLMTGALLALAPHPWLWALFAVGGALSVWGFWPPVQRIIASIFLPARRVALVSESPRMAQLGYGVSMIASTTFEEAPVALSAWLKQRSRWLKGYMQTWLVHMRHPLRLLKRAGPLGFLAFQLFLGGGIVFALVNPVLWAAFLAAALFPTPLWSGLSPVPGASLLANNLMLTYLAVMSPGRRGRGDLAPWGLTVIVYWAFVSVAGYRALGQLITRPFFWEKTAHGVTPDLFAPTGPAGAA